MAVAVLEAYLQRRITELKAIADTHQGMRYRYFMLGSLEHDAALDALYFVQSLLGSSTIANADDCLLGRLGLMERLYGGRWPAIARKSASPPSPLHCDGEGWTRSGRGEADPLAQHLSDQFSTPSLGSIARLRLEAGVAALSYLNIVLTSTSQRTIIAALLGLERAVLNWWAARSES
jgi:hypothetical protein